MRTIEEWYNTLNDMVEGTEFEIICKPNISNPVVAIVPKGCDTPQRIAVYPKKTTCAGLVFEQDIFEIPRVATLMGTPHRDKSNRPHYNRIPDETIIEVCKAFLLIK
jgi:hypothetical protein